MNDRPRSQRSGVPTFAPAIGLREVLEASPDLVFSIDPWGRLVWASSAFEQFTGRRHESLIWQMRGEVARGRQIRHNPGGPQKLFRETG